MITGGPSFGADRPVQAGPSLVDYESMRESDATKVYIRGTNPAVEGALARTIAEALGKSAHVLIGKPETADSGDIVVTTDGASSWTDVSNLAQKGEYVIVLAAIPNERAEAGYRQAGARAYLPMVAAVGPLVATLTGLMSLAEAR